MKISILRKSIFVVILIAVLISCNDKQGKFTIEGKITDANEQVLYLERKSLSENLVIDSIKLDKDGNYKFTEVAPEYPEFYSLKLGSQSINFAVDSIESIIINAPKDTFAVDYTVEGSGSSSKIKDIAIAQYKLSKAFTDLKKKHDNKEITDEEYNQGVLDGVAEYKALATGIILSDYQSGSQSMAAYYAIFQKVDNLLIFDPYSKEDIRLFQSIATIWDQQKSRSPRAAHLKNFTLSALSEVRKGNAMLKLGETQETTSSSYYDITLPDMQNNNISLSSLKGKVVILDFTAYGTQYSPAHNMMINKVHSKYPNALEVYQISFDPESHTWRNTASNLPWICVRDAKSESSTLFNKFNIQGLPTTFIIDKEGNIVKRMENKDDLDTEVRKIL